VSKGEKGWLSPPRWIAGIIPEAFRTPSEDRRKPRESIQTNSQTHTHETKGCGGLAKRTQYQKKQTLSLRKRNNQDPRIDDLTRRWAQGPAN
jgi:hypothetical protein